MLQRLKVLMEYRVSFIIGASSTLFIQLTGILTIWIVMKQIPDLNGWSLESILFIYGMLTVSMAINRMLADNLWTLGESYIRTGAFDRLLIRPLNPLFHLLADRFCHDGLGELVIGLVLIIYSGTHMDINWTPAMQVFLVISILCGGIIFFSINLITCVTSFWIYDSISIMISIHELHTFAKYPLTIFPKAIRVVLTAMIPYAFASFYPASYILGMSNNLPVWSGPAVSVILLFIGYRVWLFGLKHYKSSGS